MALLQQSQVDNDILKTMLRTINVTGAQYAFMRTTKETVAVKMVQRGLKIDVMVYADNRNDHS